MIPQNTPIGSDIVCVDDRPCMWSGSETFSGTPSNLEKGKIYTFLGWSSFPNHHHIHRSVLLAELTNFCTRTNIDMGFRHTRFRLPLYTSTPQELLREVEKDILVKELV